VKEQEYSLNPGRYVGVVIEEDGKTEEEFIADLLNIDRELAELNSSTTGLAKVIAANVRALSAET
jgi:type I restriction enzyme M protein